MSKPWRVFAWGLLLGTAVGAAPPAHYSESFDWPDGQSPVAFGWRLCADGSQSRYEVRGGALRITCLPNQFNGGYIEIPVPVVRRGTLEFDANIACENPGNARGLALSLDLYNIGLWWHDACRDWRRYFPQAQSRRMPGFTIEPVGHRSLAPVGKGTWKHYKIVFDADQDSVEYYLDNMVDPVAIDFDVPVLGSAVYRGSFLRIGSLGVVSGPVVYALDNLVLRPSEPADKAGAREEAIIFRGFGAGHYQLDQLVKALGVASSRSYPLTTWRAADSPRNAMKLERLPAAATLQRARYIILADMPFGPDEVVPAGTIQELLRNVRDGATLLILAGPFALENGCYRGTSLEPALPVKLTGGAGMTKASAPLILRPADLQLGSSLNWKSSPSVFYYQALLPHGDDAKVLLWAGERPLLIGRPAGKGRIYVFLGAPCGGEPSRRAFWDWEDWPRLLAEIING